MPAPPITRILVAGAGTMGSQIAMVCALAGYRATAYDIDADALDRARTQLGQRMSRTVAKGQIPRQASTPRSRGWLSPPTCPPPLPPPTS